MENNHLACPNCRSENTAAVSLVYKRGHATGTATHREIVGYDVETTTTTYADGSKTTEETGRHAVYGDVTRPTYTVTDLAREIAPPPEPKLRQLEHDTLTVGCISFGCLLPILSLWNDRRNINEKNRTLKKEYEQAVEEYSRRLAEWEKLFICMRCGHIFKP